MLGCLICRKKFNRNHYLFMKLATSFILLLALLTCACSMHSKAPTHFVKITPGTIPLNDTLFCDKTEITNFNWLEYLAWTRRAYGLDSPEYQKILPLADAWSDHLCLVKIDTFYLRHPAYRDYPVIGISQEQAHHFSQWRSDRVFEYYLCREKFMELDTVYSNTFTITGYFDGSWSPSYLQTDPSKLFIRDTSLYFPVYRLPTRLDRAIMLDYVDSTDFRFAQVYPKREQKWMETHPVPLYLELNPCDSALLLIEPVISVIHGYPIMRQIKFLYNIRGNVAEWSSEKDLTFGGGWPHTRSYVFKFDTISSSTPNAWTGFRNVCTWKKFDFTD